MLRWRALAGFLMVTLLAGVGSIVHGATAGPRRTPSGRSTSGPAKYLEIYYTSPVLVRAGERVLMPVDVVCATAEGRACAASVTIGTRVGAEPWTLLSVPAVAGLRFDLTSAAARAVARGASGSVQFFLRAMDGNRFVSLPEGGARRPLQFFVTRSLPASRMPRIAWGHVRRGRTVLSLPWGSGSFRAGLEVGRQSATRGPAGFDVDRFGRVYVLDSLQGRLVGFHGRRLFASAAVSVGADAALSIGPNGRAVVAGRGGPSLMLTQLGFDGEVRTANLGAGLPSQVRMVAGQAFARTLPLDAWVSASPAAGPSVGLPLTGGGQLVRVGSEDRLRMARVSGAEVTSSVELTPPAGVSLGEVALTEDDGRGGYWVVVRVSADPPAAADQYEVLHVRAGRRIKAFAVSSRSFADVPPMARFVLGRDGALYQMTSSPEFLRVLRYDLGEER